ncbi:hypothetical protein [Photorhabdus sp. SF281]|uniref:hypothetical protein n=1 Tax=Photorhabdus sp. SF281 TaxID=3459527 RepID=UPI0040445916
MTNREEFFSYLSEASKIVEQWPEWKKGGLRTTRNQYISRKDHTALKTRGYAIFAKNKLG